jgi:hypothetical protein
MPWQGPMAELEARVDAHFARLERSFNRRIRQFWWFFTAAALIFATGFTIELVLVKNFNEQTCTNRKEARDGVRDTLSDLVLTRPAPTPDDPTNREPIPPDQYTATQRRIAERIGPGGKLEPILCGETRQ